MSVLRAEALSVKVPSHLLLREVSLAFEPNRLHLIIGPNGAGKSTLLKTMLGLMVPSGGHVLVQDQDVHLLKSAERAKHLSYMPQHLEFYFETRVVDFLELSRFAYDETMGETNLWIDRGLEAVGATALKEARFNTLSGGERQRILLAACITQQAPIMLLDEPDSSLDPAHQIALQQLIRHILEQGQHTVILVTHHWNPYLTLRPLIHGFKAGTHQFSCNVTSLHHKLPNLFDCGFHQVDMDAQLWSLPKYS